MPQTPVDRATLTPPRPGAWELEQTHLTGPPSGFIAPIFPVAMPRGFGAGLREYGTLLEPFDVAIIGGFIYMCPRAVGAPLDAEGPPPRLVFEIMRRIHPEMRRRMAKAKTVFSDKRWRTDVALWDNEVKPSLLAEAAALKAEDPRAMDDARLADHVRRTAAFLARAIESHHRFNVCALMPVGDFLVQATAWTGLTPSALLEACRGLSAPSAGAMPEMARLTAALGADAEAKALLLSGGPAAAVVEQLLGRSGSVGEAMRAYLDVVGLRCLGGYDIAERCVQENPELLLRIIRAALERPAGLADTTALTNRALAAARAKVPPEHQAEFDALFEEVRFTYRIRDERNFFGDALATGIARRAVLEAGRRLASRGQLQEADHALDATADELVTFLTGGQGPAAADIAARYRFRHEADIKAMPANLGLTPTPPPPDSWFPGEARRVARAVGMAMDLMFGVHAAPPSAKVLKGFPASPGVYEGRARVVRQPSELPQVEAGEVLVTPSTSPTFNAVLPLIGAIVTERGGALCHAAIVAREYGLPAVVGSMHALKSIQTGMRLRVDGAAGEVTLLD